MSEPVCEWCHEAEATGLCASCETPLCDGCCEHDRCPVCGELRAVDEADQPEPASVCQACGDDARLGTCGHCGAVLCRHCDGTHTCADSDVGEAPHDGVTGELLAVPTGEGEPDWDAVALGDDE